MGGLPCSFNKVPRTGQSGAVQQHHDSMKDPATSCFSVQPTHLVAFILSSSSLSAVGVRWLLPSHLSTFQAAAEPKGRSNLRCLLSLLPFKGLFQKPNPTSSIYIPLARTISQSHSYLENARIWVFWFVLAGTFLPRT